MTLSKARRVAWTKIVGKLPQLWPATFVWRVQSCRAVVLLGDSSQDALITDPLPSDLNVLNADGNSIGSLRTLVGQRLLGADGASIVQQEAREDGTKIISYALEFGQEQYLVDLSGVSRQVAGLLYEIALDRITGNPVPLKTASYGAAQVAWGPITDFHGFELLTIVEEFGKPSTTIMTRSPTSPESDAVQLPDASEALRISTVRRITIRV